MSNVTVTILQNGRCDDYGIPLVAGSSYSLDYDKAKSLWQAGFASVADPSVFDDDNTPKDGMFLRSIRIVGFRRSLLASLVANSTATRSNGLVTVTAAGHGILTGATYAGYRFFYPGSANLVAGWYDSIVAIPDANTLTFTAPGADFGSQSINSAAAYTTATNLPSGLTIPANTLVEDASLKLSISVASLNTAATKTVRPFLGTSSIASSASGTTFNCGVKEWGFTPTDSGLLVGSLVAAGNAGSGLIASLAVNFNTELTVLIQLNVSAAADFVAIVSSPKLVIF